MGRSRSRFNRRIERQSKRNFAISILGIILVLLLLIKFGIPALANFALFLSGSKDTPQANSGPNFLTTPTIFSIPTATNSAKITIKGRAEATSTVDLYLNGDIIDKIEAEKNGDFSFDLNLLKGENKIFVKSKLNSNTSDASDEIAILFKDTKPLLTVENPSDGQSFSGENNFITVSGTTDAQIKVTVNGFWSIVDQNNKFTTRLLLQNGDNEIKVVAEDTAGNKTEKMLKVRYSP